MANKKYSHDEIVERMKYLMNPKGQLNESKKQDNSLLYWETAADKRKYGIIKENSKYFIKTSSNQLNEGLDSTDFAYIGGLQNKLDYRYNAYSEALKNLKMKVASINEAIDKEYKSATWDYTKKLIQEGVHDKDEKEMNEAEPEMEGGEEEVPAEEPEMEAEPEGGEEEVPAEEPEMEAEPEGGEEEEVPAEEPEMDAEPEGGEEEVPAEPEGGEEEVPAEEPEMEAEPEGGEEEAPAEEPEMEAEPEGGEEETDENLASVISKFGSHIRKKSLTPSQIKSVINTVISSVDLAQLSMEERNLIAKSFKKGERVDEEDMDEAGNMYEGEFKKYLKTLKLNESSSPEEISFAVENFILESNWNNKKVDYNEINKYVSKKTYGLLDESIQKKVKPLHEEMKEEEEEELEVEEDVIGGIGSEEGEEIEDMPMDNVPMETPEKEEGKSVHVDLKDNTVHITLKEEKVRKFINAITEEKLGLRKLSNKVKSSKNYKVVSEMVEKEIKKQKQLKEQNELKSVIQEAIDDALNNL